MQCVILAGGLGTRMRPVTQTIPKAMVPILGVPFVDHQLRWLARHGVTEAVFCVAYLAEQIVDFVGDGSRYGLRATYVNEGPKLMGTAGAVRTALDAGALDDAFLLTYGDSYLPVDFSAVWRAFKDSGAPALMTVFRNRGRGDTSNVLYTGGATMLYDKKRRDPAVAARMEHIDYGLSAYTRDIVAQRVPAATVMDLADLQHALSVEGLLRPHEVSTRFYEAGSPAGVADLEAFLSGPA